MRYYVRCSNCNMLCFISRFRWWTRYFMWHNINDQAFNTCGGKPCKITMEARDE